MNEAPLGVLFGALGVLLVLSAAFSGSETGLMTLNRYRLRHQAKSGHPGARRAAALLDQPDRLIGLILLGNNFVNILASALTTVIAIRLGGEGAIAIGAGLLTLVVLVFSEVAPKTLAALRPEVVAYPAAFVYQPLLKLLYPLVWVVNLIANGLLALLGVRREEGAQSHLTREELRTVVSEAGAMIPKRHQQMLIGLLDLEQVKVEDIMVPRTEIEGIDVNDGIEEIIEQLRHLQYTRVPLFRSSIDDVVGFVHVRDLSKPLLNGELTKERLLELARPAYFIPESTSLNRLLLNFQHERRKSGLVVDEYGDILGLATVEDILEEVVGNFTTDPGELFQDITRDPQGDYIIDAAIAIRDLNRLLELDLPTDGPKTLNGLILEHLEAIPETGISLRLHGLPMEILQIKDNQIRTVKLIRQDAGADADAEPQRGDTSGPADTD